MEYRQLGKTSLLVSTLGFGASPLGDFFGRIDPAEGEAAVHFAVDHGINYFDVSPYYGLTLAESRLGKALEGRRQQVVLATKCGRYGIDQFDFTAARITASIEESLSRLRTDYVDLLQAHDVEFGEVSQIVAETLPALRALQKQGKARYIGITGYSLKNLMEIASRVEVDTILTYCRHNLMVTDIDTAMVPFAKQRGIGIVNASPLHSGVLTERGTPDWHPASTKVRNAGRGVVTLCRDHGVDVSQVALRFCLDHVDVATTLVGMSSREHVKANLRCLTVNNDPELLSKIHEIVSSTQDGHWPSGRPENYG